MPIILQALPIREYVEMSTLYKDILPHVPGCPIEILQHEIRRVAQHFCTETLCINVEIKNVRFAAGEGSLVLEPEESEFEFVQIFRNTMFYEGRELEPTTLHKLSQAHSPRNWIDEQGEPGFYFMSTPNTVTLWPKPMVDSVNGARFFMAVKPSETTTVLPAEFVKRHRQAIFVGTRGRLMAYPNKEWTNMDGASGYGAAYQGLVDQASAQVLRGNVSAKLSSFRKVSFI